MKFIYFILLTAILIAAPVDAQVKFTVKVAKKVIGLDQHLRVEFSMDQEDDVSSFTPPEFKNFKVVGGPMRAMNTTIVNGVQNSETIYSYIITPKALGTFSIGAAQITIAEKTYKTAPITITVSNAVNSTSVATAPHENIYMLTSVSKEKIGVKDSLIVSHKVYVSPDVGILNWKLIAKPTYTNCTSDVIEIEKLTVENVTYNAKEFRATTWGQDVLKPKNKGFIHIAPVHMEIEIKYLSGTNDIFGKPIYETKTIQVTSKEVRVPVL
ncbi:BatD family protein [Cellulophaga sp. E16_2]|uniref:BatD family protein n=1 Tax=Cellulophaga sp. E16_2 TaxID=2789297 RepID=UPI001A914023|nr:BatD family protein [Cellulophaga sp. E16_2]MBO0589878.1 BatD family protein [Cellulophaga sp. E16_2]